MSHSRTVRSPGVGNGRADAVRTWLKRQRTPKSARDHMDALEPRGDINRWCATLGQLAKTGELKQHGHGQGNVRYSYVGRPVKPTKARPPLAKPQVQPKPKAVNGCVSRPANKPTSASQIRIAPARPSITAAPVQRTQPETVAQFLARGGRIQRLGPHDVSQPLRHDHSRRAPPLEQDHPTHKRPRA